MAYQQNNMVTVDDGLPNSAPKTKDSPLNVLMYICTNFIYICAGAIAYAAIHHGLVIRALTGGILGSIVIYRWHIYLCVVGVSYININFFIVKQTIFEFRFLWSRQILLQSV